MKRLSPTGFERRHQSPLPLLDIMRDHLLSLTMPHELPSGPLTTISGRLLRLIERMRDRLELGPDAPLIVAVMGATGTGKSKLFNSLTGAPVSPSGFKRPTTMAPVMAATPDAQRMIRRDSFLPRYRRREVSSGPVAFDPESHHECLMVPMMESSYERLVLIDTPDFDSVLEANRDASKDMFDRSDAILFVTDAVKYADQATWIYLDEIRKRDKAAILVMNRLKNPLSLNDYAARLESSGLKRPLLSLGDDPTLADHDLFSPSTPALRSIREKLSEWSKSARIDILVWELGRDWSDFQVAMEDQLLPGLKATDQELIRLRAMVSGSAKSAEKRLKAGLTVAISGELKNSLIRQIQALFVRWDVLAYPRRIIGLPFRFIKDKVLVPMGIMDAGQGPNVLTQEIDRLFEANSDTMAAVIHELNHELIEQFISGSVGRGLSEHPDFKQLQMTSDQIHSAYKQLRLDLEEWVHFQAEELVKHLNLGEKMTFYLAQIISLTLFVSIQVQTGGGFSFFDGLLDTVLAPVLSKITGQALSKDKVRAFETEAARIHLEGCLQFVNNQVDAYRRFLDESARGLSASGPLVETHQSLTRAFEAMA
jgi:energy-coupling factor transporter ATP-binding protein EcfA2